MEKLIVDAQGQLVIPAEAVRQLGFRPGEQVTVATNTHGLLIHSIGGAWLQQWWDSMSEEDKLEAKKEAAWYESLSAAEQDALWNHGNEELEKWLDSDEDDEDEDEADDLACIKGEERVRSIVHGAA